MRILYLPSCRSQQRQFQNLKANIYPVRMAMECEKHRQDGDEVIWDSNWVRACIEAQRGYKIITEPENLPFLTLPRPDRVFTRAKDFSSGNYKFLPGTHIMSASSCVHGKCTFCCENGKPYEVRPVEDVISEIEECKRLGFREIFDDSATFPTGRWLDEFCSYVGKLGIRWSANMRIGSDVDYNSLRRSGARMLLYGIESANQITLDKINKGVKIEQIIPTLKKASEAGLEPHIAVMFGYPWESEAQANNTLRLVHYLLRKGFAKTAQASLYCPPDGQRNETHKKFVKKIYEVAYYPDFWYHKIKEIKTMEDFRYILRGIKVALNG